MTDTTTLQIATQEIFLEPADNQRLMSLCGPFDDNIKQLERRLAIEINRRDNRFKISGKPLNVQAASKILRQLYVDTSPVRGVIPDIDPENIHLAILDSRVLEQSADSVPDYGKGSEYQNKTWCNQASYTKPSAIYRKYFRP